MPLRGGMGTVNAAAVSLSSCSQQVVVGLLAGLRPAPAPVPAVTRDSAGGWGFETGCPFRTM